MNTILTKKLNAGHFSVSVFADHQEIGTFETTDMQLIDDIQEMRNGGFESELTMFDSFEELRTYCVKQANIYNLKKKFPYGIDNGHEHHTKYDGIQTR